MNTVPTITELPSSQQLVKSTVIAAITAVAILVTVVLPAEYAIDPTGIGRVLKLTDMGKIKNQLAQEAEADRQQDVAKAEAAAPQPVVPAAPAVTASAATDRYAHNHDTAAAVSAQQEPSQPVWKDEVTFTLQPGEGVEYKLNMDQGAKASYHWIAEGGGVNMDAHGDAPGRSVSYEKGKGVPSDKGTLTAAFKGSHGWYWRNRGQTAVTMKLRTAGEYGSLKRM